jgi:hypothetical protein
MLLYLFGKFTFVTRKGFYLKKNDNDGSLTLNVFVSDFKAFLEAQELVDGWVRLRIFERHKEDEKGHTHNMEVVAKKTKTIDL